MPVDDPWWEDPEVDPLKLRQRAWRLRRDPYWKRHNPPIWEMLNEFADIVEEYRKSPPAGYTRRLQEQRVKLIRTIRKGAGRPNPTSA